MHSGFYKLCANKGESFGAELEMKAGRCPHRMPKRRLLPSDSSTQDSSI